jgi:hypothetical protein
MKCLNELIIYFTKRASVKTSHKQTGSVHVVIIVILVIAVLGLLGFVFWQNFVQKKTVANVTPVATTSVPKTQQTTSGYKAFTTSAHGLSFQYPSTWTVSESVNSSADVYADTVTVKDADNTQVAALQTGVDGLGGTCQAQQPESTLDATLTAVKAADPVYASLTAVTNQTGGYDVHYGLSDSYTKIISDTVCPNTFYYVFDTGNTALGGVSFGNDTIATVHYDSLQEVKDFIASDQYAAIKKMVASLSFN